MRGLGIPRRLLCLLPRLLRLLRRLSQVPRMERAGSSLALQTNLPRSPLRVLDCHAALRETGCDGVMSGCGVLAEPSLFVGGRLSSVESAIQYIDHATRYSAHPKAIVKHLQTILGRGWLAEHAQIRTLVVAYRGEEEQPGALEEIETAIRRAGAAVA